MTNRRLSLHYLGLVGVIALGAILRFWHLGLKPLWMDEVITAIFSLGKNYHDLPLDVVFPLNRVQEIFTFQPGVSCEQIAANIATQSTHPPLFFCGMYSWLGWMSPLGTEWMAKLRSLPALFGVLAIAAIYGVNRIAFSPKSGIIAALIMAVSPFAVYLSQESRHYTQPMLIITLALFLLMQIQRDIFEHSRIRFWVWLLWAIINSIGLYVHYFFALAFIAEIATLLLLMYWGRAKIKQLRQIWLVLILSTSGVVISFLPWLLVTLSHVNRSETSWLPSPTIVAPLYQTLINWVLMVIALPVENQPLPIAVICGLLMVIFAIWLGRQVFSGLKLLWSQNTTHSATLTLLSFTIFVLLQFFAIAYLFGKDITVVPRYNFVYYPSFCALLAASLGKIQNAKFKIQNSILIFLLVGMISSIFVVSNLAFQKPFQPEQVAKNMNIEPAVPLMLVVKYKSYQDVALGLSFALAVEKIRNDDLKNPVRHNSAINADGLAFLQESPDFFAVISKLSPQSTPGISQLNLWFVGPGMRRRDYPPQLALARQTSCTIDPTQHHRIGVPYQLYRCANVL
ncbi:glycosyltransferase family 39 protein [Cylindrospermum sp. FACHB-282]|uniref:glycosyltransferase family 39 protein n=1 Tax=Cylindrospermum sp. FACHB-282 TaxID=2692794 RepID=UPI001688586D|nr:glycosyltransferase family 39 protein [Cylindrospermum sp. FACHB-282]